jgi:hypothetical protein
MLILKSISALGVIPFNYKINVDAMKNIKLVGSLILILSFILISCQDSGMINSVENIESMAMNETSLNKNGQELPEGMVYNEYNRNYYQAVEVAEGINWLDANAAATGLTYGRCESHLATITSANENEWITATFPEAINGGYWLGGKQAEGVAEPSEGWGWITGENWLYTNWEVIEPNDFGGINETALQFFNPLFDGFTEPGTWNDANEEATNEGLPIVNSGYLVEYECPTKVTGGGQALRELPNGETQTRLYSFNAQKDSGTNIKGQAQGKLKVDETNAFHMDITCQSIWGNSAWLGGIVTQSNTPNVPVGRTFLWNLVDNGQGNESDDSVGFYIFTFDSETGEEVPNDLNCALQPDQGAYSLQFTLENGNFRIH